MVKKATPAASSGAGAVTIRHYCQGIGDSHLLKFVDKNGKDFWMLIDCGVHSSVKGGSDTIDRIVDDIAATTKRLDVLVVTHEHWDHVSGFMTAAEKFAKITIGEVWMGWTEDPEDAQAKELDKFKGQAIVALQAASSAMARAALGPYLSAVGQGIGPVLGFNFGAKGEKVRAARDAATKLAAAGKPSYFEPKDPPIAIPVLPNLRIYVLGPPRDPKLIGTTDRASEMYQLGGGGWPVARALANAFQIGDGNSPAGEDYLAPFDPNVGTSLSSVLDPRAVPSKGELDEEILAFARDNYFGPAKPAEAAGRRPRRGKKSDPHETDQAWRRIDHDWLGVSADLAMQLDNKTNNTSLALAFEFVDSGRVLLFAADAQVGNWLSWQDLKWTVDGKKVTGPDLLARTVYYKVGHHGSENATLKEKGLELMTSKDLAAFIPTNQADAEKVGWGQMPLPGIVDALHRHAGDRVIRADDAWIATGKPPPSLKKPSGAIRGLRHKAGLWVELDIA